MLPLLVVGMLAQGGPCVGGVPAVRAWATILDMTRLARAVGASCTTANTAVIYVQGLADAQRAYAAGGSPESLRSVRQAIGQLAARVASAAGASGADIAGLVLQAAAAAAQSEREELALFIDQAVRLESAALARGEAGAPIVSAHEAAGQLWLRVHRFDDAAAAYDAAVAVLAATPRVLLGRARVAVRLGDSGTACAMYRRVVAAVPRDAAAAEATELGEARTYLRRGECRRGRAGSR